MLREEREAALPAVLGGLLLVDLRPVVREERVRGARVEHELDVRVRLLELGLEALDVVRRDPAVGLAVQTEHRRPDARHQAKRVDARRVGVRALDVAVPRHRRGHARVLGAHRSEEHTSELQSLAYLVCRLLLEKKKKARNKSHLSGTDWRATQTLCGTSG